MCVKTYKYDKCVFTYMSWSEVYSFTKDGYANFYGEVQNANRGCMAVWQILEKKYLPSLPIPSYWGSIGGGNYYSRTYVVDNRGLMKQIWNLANEDSPLTEEERIVLITTFDKVLVKKEMLPSVIHAYENFNGDTNLKEVAEILKKALNDSEIIAIGFSISLTDGWTNWGNEENEEGDRPYNIFKQNDHWFLGEE